MEIVIGGVVIYFAILFLCLWIKARQLNARKKMALEDPEKFQRLLAWEEAERNKGRKIVREVREDYGPTAVKAGQIGWEIAKTFLKKK